MSIEFIIISFEAVKVCSCEAMEFKSSYKAFELPLQVGFLTNSKTKADRSHKYVKRNYVKNDFTSQKNVTVARMALK